MRAVWCTVYISKLKGTWSASCLAVIAKETLEHEHLPIKGKSWSIVPWSRDLPGKTRRERDGDLSWQEYIGTIQRDSPDMIKGLTPHQILEMLTRQTKRERNEVSWRKRSMMKGQQ